MGLTNKTKHNLTNQDLSIQISLNGLSFCILNNVSNTITYLKHFEYEKRFSPFQILEKLEQIFDSEEVLKMDFMNIKAIFVNDLSTLVPASLFDENNLADYLKFNSKILKSDYIAYDHLSVNDSYNVYVPYVNITNFLFEKFGDFSYTHFSTILLEHVLKKEKNTMEPKVYVHVGRSHFEIIAMDHQGLILYNSYDYHSKEDFIYYILFALEQLDLNPEKVQLYVIGKIKKDDYLYQMVFKYVRYVDFPDPPINHRFGEGVTASNHSNFVLTNSF